MSHCYYYPKECTSKPTKVKNRKWLSKMNYSNHQYGIKLICNRFIYRIWRYRTLNGQIKFKLIIFWSKKILSSLPLLFNFFLFSSHHWHHHQHYHQNTLLESTMCTMLNYSWSSPKDSYRCKNIDMATCLIQFFTISLKNPLH